METSTSTQRPDSTVVSAARAAVASALPPEDARHALDIAGIVASLGADDEVILGALAAQMLQAGAIDEPAALRDFGAEPLRLAKELGRLGSIGAKWNPDGKLSAPQAETLRKMLLAVVGDPRLILLRLAERLQALREAKALPAAEQRHTALEAREIYAPLANRLGVGQLKWELEDLAFRYLDAEHYRMIARALNSKRREREQYIHEVRGQIESELRKAGIAAEVTGRPKHIHSIWRKMERKHLPFERVFDVRAFRILVDTVANCYAALGVVHGLWPYIEHEFDDYIATPKGNNYRSIHTAVYGPGRLPLEVQIRTHEMHQHAELGVAAHWKYKEGGARDAAYEAKIERVRRLLEPEAMQDGEEGYLDRVRGALFEDRVYAMTPKGEVVELPKGGTPLDFAYQVHTGLGHRCKGAKVNGRMVPLTYVLNTGEVVEILTGKVAQPNRDWLSTTKGFLASSRSRAKVRAYFRKLDEEAKAPEAAVEPVKILPAPRRPRKSAAGKKGVVIEGVGELPFQVARCCVPGSADPIAGYMTLSRGVSIHRRDCASFLRMKAQRPEKVLRVVWG